MEGTQKESFIRLPRYIFVKKKTCISYSYVFLRYDPNFNSEGYSPRKF